MTQQTQTTPPENTAQIVDIRHLSTAQLQQLGVSQLAYVRPMMLDGARVFAIHGADGSPMAVATEQDAAIAAIVEHEMIAALVQ